MHTFDGVASSLNLFSFYHYYYYFII